MPSRREFMQAAFTGAGIVAWGQTAPLFLSRTALAAGNSAAPGNKETVLVVVQLTGGNDGLNTVVPYADEGYAKLRKQLKIQKNDLKKIDDKFGLHPSLAGLAGLLEDHALSIVQGVGYPNPNESHFRSMDIWQAASTAENLSEGWLGKALVSMPSSPAFHVASADEPSWLSLAGAPAKVPRLRASSNSSCRPMRPMAPITTSSDNSSSATPLARPLGTEVRARRRSWISSATRP